MAGTRRLKALCGTVALALQGWVPAAREGSCHARLRAGSPGDGMMRRHDSLCCSWSRQIVRALILQFEPDDAPDHLGRRFDAHGVAWNVASMYRPHQPLSLDGYDVLVSLGGAMSV